MITALLELTSCATLEKRIVPAYQHACEQGESATCYDATQRLVKYVEEVDNAAVQQKKIWAKQTNDFIAVLHAELEAAVCYHNSMIGTKNVASSAHYYGHSSTYNVGIRD